MHALHWTERHAPTIGGVQSLMTRLLPALQEHGTTCSLFTGRAPAHAPAEETMHGTRVFRFALAAPATPDAVAEVARTRRAVRRTADRIRPDVDHLHSLGRAAFFRDVTQPKPPRPLVVTVHEPLAERSLAPETAAGRTLEQASCIACCSEAVRRDLCRNRPDLEARAAVVHHGVTPPRTSAPPLPVREPVVLGCGRFTEAKGFDMLLRAFAGVHRRHPAARLLLAGEGPSELLLRGLVAELGLSAVVSWQGPCPPEKVSELLACATLVAVPSRWAEPFGQVAVEAGCLARPVVAARTGGLPEIVHHEVTGLLVPPDNPAALADALLALLGDPERARSMGQAAAKRIKSHFSLASCRVYYETLYRKLVEEQLNARYR